MFFHFLLLIFARGAVAVPRACRRVHETPVPKYTLGTYIFFLFFLLYFQFHVTYTVHAVGVASASTDARAGERQTWHLALGAWQPLEHGMSSGESKESAQQSGHDELV
jgi:hypothetical protein